MLMRHPQKQREHPKDSFTGKCIEPDHGDGNHEAEPCNATLQSVPGE